jgi:hypothetical protein
MECNWHDKTASQNLYAELLGELLVLVECGSRTCLHRNFVRALLQFLDVVAWYFLGGKEVERFLDYIAESPHAVLLASSCTRGVSLTFVKLESTVLHCFRIAIKTS